MGLEKAAVSSKGGLNQQEGDSNVDLKMKGRSNKRSESEESKSDLSAFVAEVGKVPEDGQSLK